ncbi:hypothetical protein ABPG77_009858 [Micractinium sp. CCAP 211/92]
MSFVDVEELSCTLEVEISEPESDGEEVLSPLVAAPATAASGSVPCKQQARKQQPELTPKQKRGLKKLAAGMGRRSNATITTPRGGKQAAAAAAPEQAAGASGRTTRAAYKAKAIAAAAGATVKAVAAKIGGSSRGRKRKGADKGEQENRAQNTNAVAEAEAAAEQPAKRRRQAAAAAVAETAAEQTEAMPAAGGSGRRAGSGRKPHAAQQEQQPAASAPAPAVCAPLSQQVQPAPSQLTAVMQPSQSVHESILKSPTPPRRAKATASTAGQGIGPMQLLGAGMAAAAGAAAVGLEAGAVDQPAPQQAQQQQAEPAAAAAAVQPEPAQLAEQQPQQQQQQPGQQQQQAAAAAATEAEAERTGSSPLEAAPAKRPRASPDAAQQQQQQSGSSRAAAAVAGPAPGTSPRRQSPRHQGSPEASGIRPAGSVRSALGACGSPDGSIGRAPQPAAQAEASATPASRAAGTAAAAAAAEPCWWDPLDAEKVKAVKTALHISAYSTGRIPACREDQAAAVGSWLAAALRERRGGSIYLSGLPGTGKSLTAHEVVRQCWRGAAGSAPAGRAGEGSSGAAAEATAEGAVSPPPALMSVNCMSLTDPRQVVERILQGYGMACAASPPEAALAAGDDPIQYPAADSAGTATAAAAAAGRSRRHSAGSEPLQQLRQLALAPLPTSSPAAAAHHPSPAKGRGKAAGKAGKKGRGTKRKSSASAPDAAPAAGGCERGMLVVILDELDSLLIGARGEELVESLFCLAHARGSRLVLLGIANSIDLVQQLMRPGGSLHRHNLHPQHAVFPAYRERDFVTVLNQRLGALPGRVFEPMTITFCARKIANGKGDMRLALEACSQAAERCAKEAAEAAAAGGAAQRGAASGAGPARAPLVSMRQMAPVLMQITGGIGIGNANVQAIRALPPQQQLLMVTVGKLLGETLNSQGVRLRRPAPLAAPGSSRKAGGATAAAGRARAAFMSPTNSASSRKSAGSLLSGGSVVSGMPRSAEVLLGQLQESFTLLCRQVGMEAYDIREFYSACDNLADRGLIGLAGGREAKWRRVTLRIPEEDVVLALSDVPVLKTLVCS